MIRRDLILWIVCGLIFITSNACATKEATSSFKTLGSDSIQAFADDPTGSKLPLETGQTITIFIKEGISIDTPNPYIVRMVVVDVDITRVRGILLDNSEGLSTETKSVITEVKLKDIEFISVQEGEEKIHIDKISAPLLPESITAQQTKSSHELSSEEECKISETARTAIDAATEAWMKAGNIPEALVKPPECDNDKAIELAEKAIEIVAQESKLIEENSEITESTEVKYKHKPHAMYPDCEFDDFTNLKGSEIAVIITFLPTSLASTSARGMLYSTSAISGIDGCEKIADIKIQQYRFAAIAKDNLVRDMANGGGEYVTALAYLQGCPIEIHSRYAEMTQLSFHQIFPSPQTGPKTILSNLETEIVKDPLLAKECKWVS